MRKLQGSPAGPRRGGLRGVVLVYVLILIAITAYLSSMLLNSTFSRRISSQVTMNSGQTQSDLVAAESMVTSCFAAKLWPVSYNCVNPPCIGWPYGMSCGDAPVECLSGTLPGLPERRYTTTVCAGIVPPCRIRINVCRRGEADDAAATCPQPPGC